MSGPLGSGGGPVCRPPRPEPPKKVVVVASFSGDARWFLERDQIHERDAIILTPDRIRGLDGYRGEFIEKIFDIRRPPVGPQTNLGLDSVVGYFCARYPDVPYEVVPR